MERAGTEIRLAIVMNGGVSLAVWMGGVAHEIDLLRRASRVANGASREEVGGIAAYDREIFEKWIDFCSAHAVGNVVIDVVAGTSAGGLNGTLLSTAIARGIPLDPGTDRSGPWLRGLWMQKATLDAGNLLRAPGKAPVPSVFDGDYFTATVAAALGDLSPSDGRRIPSEPVTLFVASTSLGPSDRRYRDSFTQPFDVPDHRRLYRFSRNESGAVRYAPPERAATTDESWWQPNLVDEFASSTEDGSAQQALVTAARASASFPFAFVPVRETPELAARRVFPPRSADHASGHYLTDGGILDNAPFQPVLDAITRRPLTQPVRRMLVYVVPSAGTTAKPVQPAADLPAWDRIGASVVGFPSESDIRTDVEMAEDLVTRAEGRTAAPEACFRDAVAGDPAMIKAAAGLLAQYRLARVVGGLLEVRGTLAVARPTLGTTLAPRSVEHAEELVRGPVPWLPAADAEPGEAYRDGDWTWGLAAAERVVRLMVRDLRTRFDQVGDRASASLEVISACLSRIEAVRDTFRETVVADAASAPPGDAELIAWTAERFAALRVQAALGWCVRTAADAYAGALPASGDAAGAVRAGLAVEVSTQAFSAYQPFTRTAPFQLLRLGPDVESPMVDRDPTRAEAARTAGARKLYGTRLRHFAAFGLPAWRAWDWTAGRLDAQTHLARALVATDRADDENPLPRADQWVAQVQELTVAAELNLDPPAWQDRRHHLGGTDDAGLLAELRKDPSGEDLAVSVVDALMRALPHERALGATGLVLNSLFARKPQRRLAKPWTPFARPFTRLLWRRKVASLVRRPR